MLGRPLSNKSTVIVGRLRSDGTLDESYGHNGWLNQTLDGALQLHQGRLMESGKLVLGGEDFITTNQFLFQIMPNGTRDFGFSQDGFQTIDLDQPRKKTNRLNLIKQPNQELTVMSGTFPGQGTLGRGDRVDSMGITQDEFAVQPMDNESKMIADPKGGWYEFDSRITAGQAAKIYIRKYYSNGLRDFDFGTSGLIQIESEVIHSETDIGATIGPDGSLFVFVSAGRYQNVAPGTGSATLVKVSKMGKIDLNFGTQGIVTLFDSQFRLAAIVPNTVGGVNLITKAAESNGEYGFKVIALKASGQIDLTYNSSGETFIATSYDPIVNGATIDEQGRNLILCDAGASNAVFAINPNGLRDVNFGDGGRVILPIEDLRYSEEARLAVQRGVVAIWGTQSGVLETHARLIALDYSGRLDTRLNGVGYRDVGLEYTYSKGDELSFADDGSLYIGLVYDVAGSSLRSVIKLEGTGDTLIHNWKAPLDVNNNSIVSPADALVVINYLNRKQGGVIPGLYDGINFPDVNDDLHVTPTDALIVIDYLNRRPRGEGELAEDLLVLANWSITEDEFASFRKRPRSLGKSSI